MNKGKAFRLFLEEVAAAAGKAAGYKELAACAGRLSDALKVFKSTTDSLLGLGAQGKTAEFLSDASLYLEMAGTIAIAWQWLLQGISAAEKLHKIENKFLLNFYNAKIETMKFFFRYELPSVSTLAEILTDNERITTVVDNEIFND